MSSQLLSRFKSLVYVVDPNTTDNHSDPDIKGSLAFVTAKVSDWMTITLLKGTYKFQSPLLSSSPHSRHISIVGQGKDTILYWPQDQGYNDKFINSALYISNLTITGGTDINLSDTTSSDLIHINSSTLARIDKVFFKHIKCTNIIRIVSMNGLNIHNCTFDNIDAEFLLSSGNLTELKNNIFNFNSNSSNPIITTMKYDTVGSINIIGNTFIGDSSANNVIFLQDTLLGNISKNTFEYISGGAPDGEGAIKLNYQSTFSDNIILNNPNGDGIKCEGDDVKIVTNNYIRNCSGYGISVYGRNTSVPYNRFQNCLSGEIYVDPLVLADTYGLAKVLG